MKIFEFDFESNSDTVTFDGIEQEMIIGKDIDYHTTLCTMFNIFQIATPKLKWS